MCVPSNLDSTVRLNPLRQLVHIDEAWRQTRISDFQLETEMFTPSTDVGEDSTNEFLTVESVMANITANKKRLWIDNALEELKLLANVHAMDKKREIKTLFAPAV